MGNPSDGYGGRTLALAVDEMLATVTVVESDSVRISGPNPDPFEFASISEFANLVDRYGLGTGEQLLAGGLRSFVDLARSQEWTLPSGVEVRFESTIPRGVGLAGSSALLISLLRGMLDLCDRTLAPELLASLARSAEVDQLGIVAGLQDRVVQTFGGLVAMDFSTMTTDARTGLAFGRYEQLDPARLPRLFLVYAHRAAQPSTHYHRVLRDRFAAGDPATLAALHELAGLVVQGKAALAWGGSGLGPLLDRNMELRRAWAPIAEGQLELYSAVSGAGLPATFAGSGGAVVGVLDDDAELGELKAAVHVIGATVVEIRPFEYLR